MQASSRAECSANMDDICLSYHFISQVHVFWPRIAAAFEVE